MKFKLTYSDGETAEVKATTWQNMITSPDVFDQKLVKAELIDAEVPTEQEKDDDVRAAVKLSW